jgi:hypothetical protein
VTRTAHASLIWTPSQIRLQVTWSAAWSLIWTPSQLKQTKATQANPSGRADQDVGLQPAAYWDCGFESRRVRGCLFRVCCQAEVSASSWSLVHRSPTECGVSYGVWSWSIDNAEALVHYVMLRRGGRGEWGGGEVGDMDCSTQASSRLTHY